MPTFPYDYIADPTKGRPLFNASLYFGQPDLDPTVAANQIDVYAIQEDGSTVKLTQPVSTGAGGVPLYNDAPARLEFAASRCSFKALDKGGSQVYYVPSIPAAGRLFAGQFPDTASAITFAKLVSRQLTLTEDTTVNLPSDAASLQDVFDVIAPQPGVRVTAHMESGFSPATGSSLDGGDYSQFEITSADATVTLSPSWPASTPFLKGVNAVLPTLNALIDCNAVSVGELGAIEVRENSRIKLESGAGIINNGSSAAANLFVYRNSRATGSESVFTGAAFRNVWVTHRSDGYLEDGDFSGAAGANVFVSRGSTFYGAGGDFSDSGEEGLLVRRSIAIVIPAGLTSTLFDNNGTVAISAQQGSKVLAHSRNGMPVVISNAVTHGIDCSGAGSSVDISGGEFTTVAFDAIRVDSLGAVLASTADFAGVGRDICKADGGAAASLESCTATSAGRYGIYGTSGARVVADSANFNSAGTSAIYVTDCDVSARNLTATNCVGDCIVANASSVTVPGCTGTGAGGLGIAARDGSTVNANDSNFSGATTGGATVTDGSNLSAVNANLQAGGSPASTDLVIGRGAVVKFFGGTGGTSHTVNTLQAQGIIFQ